MIRWCAYCQRYQGEVAPHEDFSITHTICASCVSRRAYESEEGADLRPLREFFARLANPGLGRLPSPSELVAEGTALGIDPVDLLLGVVQPVLQQIGLRWSRSEITVAEEHRVTALCAAIIDSIASRDPGLQKLRDAHPPDVLLVGADGNYHTLGIQLLEVLLLRAGVSVYPVYPGIPLEETVGLAQRLSPKVIAISVALPNQMRAAIRVAEQVAAWPGRERPRVVLGGRAVLQAPPAQEAPFVVCQDTRCLVELVEHGRLPETPRGYSVSAGLGARSVRRK